MKITAFSVKNFRSITTAKKVSITNYSVLIGANNEGKSNILHALAIGMDAIESFKYSIRRDVLGRIIRPRAYGRGHDARYDWSRDFPISQQAKNRSGCTEITIEFVLDQQEIDEFASEVGNKTNGNLAVIVRFSENKPDISIAKQGPGGASLNKKRNRVAEFLSRRLNFEYIPTIRTSDSAREVVSELVNRELARLEDDPDYRAAIARIEELQKPTLLEMSKKIKDTVSSFLPSVKSVEFTITQEARHRAFGRALSIEVDDGNKTPLERKGDGVKSLVTLALMRYASEAQKVTGSTVIAIEEPESHLHPKAIHELRGVLLGLSEKNQVILTSHSPIFVNPADLKSTIIVQGSKAGPAASISEVRRILGVRLSDNLQSARLVAIFEGADDIIIAKAIIKSRFPAVHDAISNGAIAFDDLGGASNLSYKVRMYRSSATLVQCFLDNDVAGRDAVSKAEADGLIKTADYNVFSVPGMADSELEDLISIQSYAPAFLAEFGVDPKIKPPQSKGKKWSDAMKFKFQAHGKLWDNRQEAAAKLWMAKFVENNLEVALIEERMAPVEAFLDTLQKKVGSML